MDRKRKGPMFGSPSTICSPIFTPTASLATDTPSDEHDIPPRSKPASTVIERLWQSHGEVPWPGNTYHIIRKGTCKALTSGAITPALLPFEDNRFDPRTQWHCVEKNGYFGFQNPSSGVFLGHDGSSGMRTSAVELKKWEMWTTRQHPEGGYQLLSPFWSDTLLVLCVAEDGKALVRRTHGTTYWEFVRVDK